MRHPSLGLPPRDLTVGRPDAAAALHAARVPVAARTLEAAVVADPTLAARHDELALREILADLEAMIERLGTAIAANDTHVMAHWADMILVRYRKRRIPLDDLTTLTESLRRIAAQVVTPDAMDAVDASLDAAIAVYRWNRRLGGDGRKRHPLVALIYKGA
jgi:hypothetical protein